MTNQWINETQQKEIDRAEFRKKFGVGNWFMVERQGFIVEMDEKLHQRLGYWHASSVLGKHHSMLVPEEHREKHKQFFEDWWVRLHSQPVLMNRLVDYIPIVNAAGDSMPVSLSIIAYNDRAKHTTLLDMPGTTSNTPVNEAAELAKFYEYAMGELVFLEDVLRKETVDSLIAKK